jgi:hypothetical protein
MKDLKTPQAPKKTIKPPRKTTQDLKRTLKTVKPPNKAPWKMNKPLKPLNTSNLRRKIPPKPPKETWS